MYQKPPYPRVPENAPGDFYVEADACLHCCLVHFEAPDLMNDRSVSFRDCYFRRQPENDAEIEQAIQAVAVADVGSLRYGGTDQAIIRRLHLLGCAMQCDNPLLEPDE